MSQSGRWVNLAQSRKVWHVGRCRLRRVTYPTFSCISAKTDFAESVSYRPDSWAKKKSYVGNSCTEMSLRVIRRIPCPTYENFCRKYLGDICSRFLRRNTVPTKCVFFVCTFIMQFFEWFLVNIECLRQKGGFRALIDVLRRTRCPTNVFLEYMAKNMESLRQFRVTTVDTSCFLLVLVILCIYCHFYNHI